MSPETLSQPGQNGYVVISWSPPPPASCSVTFDQNPISYGGGTTMHWTSSNAYQLYIRNYGNVTPNTSGSVALSGRTSTTDFSCYAYGYGGDSGWQSATLTVNPPASCTPPWGGSIPSGQSAIAYQSSSAVYGTSCVSQTRTCSNGSLSGSYSYSSCAVQAPSNCTLAGATVANGASHDFYSISSAPAGQLCSAYAQTRTCTNGSLDGSSSYGLASCSCSPIYTCSGSTIQHVESDCSVTTVATCAAPTFCSPGGSSCRYPDPIFVRHGSDTGHLRAVPELVQLRSPVNLYWNVSEVQSCTVSGTNGDSWTELTGAQVSSPITEQTVFTLSCLEWNNTTLNESQTVNVAPVFQER